MKPMTSLLWSVLTVDYLIDCFVKMLPPSTSFSLDTYPKPRTVTCAFDYLSLAYLCDPDHWFSHTDALKLDNWLRSKMSRLKTCNDDENWTLDFEASTQLIDARKFSLGISLANEIHLDGLEHPERNKVNRSRLCSRNNSRRRLSFLSAQQIQRLIDRAAENIRQIWNSPNSQQDSKGFEETLLCQFDVLILITRRQFICGQQITYRNENTDSRAYKVGLGYMPSLRVALSTASTNLTNRFMFLNYSNREPSITSEQIATLVFDLEKLINSSQNGAFRDTGKRQEPADADERRRRAHSIPIWALVACAVSLCVTLSCTALGHCIQSGGIRNRFRQRDKSYALKGSSGDRRWRAGFAGGVVDMHQHPASEKRSAIVNPGSGINKTGSLKKKSRGTLFVSVNKSREQSRPTYHRV